MKINMLRKIATIKKFLRQRFHLKCWKFNIQEIDLNPYIMDSNIYFRMSLEYLREDQIQILEVWIWIRIPKNFLRSEKVKFSLWIQIPEVWIRIRILEAFSKVKKWYFTYGFESQGMDSNPKCKISNKSCNLHSDKERPFVHVPDIFWLGLFLTNMKIRS